MATLFIILLVLGIFHFIYEAILVPTLRLELRYKLFKLRDELRSLKAENNSKVADNELQLGELEEAICAVINRLSFFNISTVKDAVIAYKENESFQKSVEKRKNIFESCKDQKINQINKKLIDITTVAFIINSGGWLYIVIPFLIVIGVFAIITKSVVSMRTILRKATYKVAYSWDYDFSNFTHFA